MMSVIVDEVVLFSLINSLKKSPQRLSMKTGAKLLNIKYQTNTDSWINEQRKYKLRENKRNTGDHFHG